MIFEPISLLLKIVEWISIGSSILVITLKSVRSVLFYPMGALWYMQAVIIAVVVLIPLIKRKKEFWAIPFGILGYAFALLANRYYFLIADTFVADIVDIYLYIFVSARNGLFVGVIYITIGLLISKYEYWFEKNIKLVRTVCLLSMLLYVFEGYCLRNHIGVDDNALYIMHLLFVPSLFIVAINPIVKIKANTKLFRNLSTSVYLLHSPVLMCVQMIHGLFGDAIATYWITVVAAFILIMICLIIYCCKLKPIYQWII